jgi:transposase InsO family protein
VVIGDFKHEHNHRPHSQLDYIPPDEDEATYYASRPGVPAAASQL